MGRPNQQGRRCSLITILIDADDTIHYLLKAWVTYLNKKYGQNVNWLAIRSWDICKAFPNLTHAEVYRALQDKALWDMVEPLPFASLVIEKLIEEGHSVYLVTSSYYKTVPVKFERAIFKYFPMIDWEHVIVACNKQMIKGDVLIDDGPHNLEGGDYAKILVSSPHNFDYPAEENGMVRVRSWFDIYNEIQKIAGSDKRMNFDFDIFEEE